MLLNFGRRSTILNFYIGKEKYKVSKNTDNILYGWNNIHYYNIYDFYEGGGFPLSSKMRKSHYYVSTKFLQNFLEKAILN